MNNNEWHKAAILIVAAAIFIFAVRFSLAEPSGAQIADNMSSSALSSTPHDRNDSGGTITTMILSATQQDNAWKGYHGNVTGLLTLDDASAQTIYNWQLASVKGEVYASRSNAVNWAVINCSNQSIIDNEQTALSFTSADSDAINRTFNSTNHLSFIVSARNMSNCRSTSTYVNDSVQPQTPTALYQEMLLTDGTNLVYGTLMSETSQPGYNSQAQHFQLIVPQSKITQTPTTYYFYVELG
jgi:hypothetical protein